ncbi:hypothetical protein QBC36DRAFT_293282, partial [Triangularia setosa]
MLPETTRPHLTQWTLPHPVALPRPENKELGKRAHERLLREAAEGELHLYSDGSKAAPAPDLPKRTGWGFVAYISGQKIHEEHGRLGDSEAFDGEAVGAAHASVWAREYIRRGASPPRVRLFIDNAAVLYGITGRPSDNSQEAFLAIGY